MLTIAIITAVIAALGSIGALFAFLLKYSNRIAFAERDSKDALVKANELDKQMAATKEHVTMMEGTLAEIKTSLSKLSLIEALKVSVDSLKESMGEVKTELQAIRNRDTK